MNCKFVSLLLTNEILRGRAASVRKGGGGIYNLDMAGIRIDIISDSN